MNENNSNNVNYNVTNNTSNNKSSDNVGLVIGVIVGVISLIVVCIGGYLIWNQYKLKKVDDELKEEAKDINNSLDADIEINTEKENKVKVGDSVTLVDGSSWYVLDSSNNQVTLLSSVNYGEETYFSASENVYSSSIVKDIIDNQFLPELQKSLSENGGNLSNISARIITVDEIRKVVNDYSSANEKIEILSEYNWLYNTGSYWTMTEVEGSTNFSVYIVESWGSFGNINTDIAGYGLGSGNKFNVRPVIECSIDNLK